MLSWLRCLMVMACAFNGAWAFSQTLIKTDVIYDQVNGQNLVLDLYLPENPPSTPMPTIVYTHGGCFNCGDKKNIPSELRRLVEDGFAIASIGYRLAPEYVFPAGLIDAQQAVRFLRANAKEYGIDPRLVASYGESAGGTIASLLGVHSMPSRTGELDEFSAPVAAVADWYGRTDLARVQPKTGGDCASVWLGMPKTPENLPHFRAASVLPFVSKDSAPFFIVHGTNDGQVEPLHSVLLAKALRSVGVPYELYFSEGDKHGMTAPEAWKLTRSFFLRTLKQVPFPQVAQPLIRVEMNEKNANAQNPPSVFYRSEKAGNLTSYHFPVENGAYRVRLHFSDCTRILEGEKVLNVSVDSVLALPEFDVSQLVAGIDGVGIEEFGVIARSGFIDLSFLSLRAGAAASLSTIEIIPVVK